MMKEGLENVIQTRHNKRDLRNSNLLKILILDRRKVGRRKWQRFLRITKDRKFWKAKHSVLIER